MKGKSLYISICSLFIIIAFHSKSPLPVYQGEKHRGMHFFENGSSTTSQELQSLQNAGIEWITLVPYGFQEDYNSSAIDSGAQGTDAWSEDDMQLMQTIQTAKNAGFKIFIKPHLYLNNPTGKNWRAEISQNSQEEWKAWSVDYRAFILHYAQMSEEKDAELFCIGMELYEIVKRHPDFWEELIKDVRAVYSGQIVYAANWYEEFEEVTFWESLDFIGIQAYFPLTNKQNPSTYELKKGWAYVLPKIEMVARSSQKSVLFTEIGYKSTSDAAIEPWQWVEHNTDSYIPSNATQTNAYDAFFQTCWKKDWFAGVHLWQWRAKEKKLYEMGFSPKGKPATKVMKKWFTKR